MIAEFVIRFDVQSIMMLSKVLKTCFKLVGVNGEQGTRDFFCYFRF